MVLSTIAITWLLQFSFGLAAHMLPRPKTRGRKAYRVFYKIVQFTAANLDRYRQVGR